MALESTRKRMGRHAAAPGAAAMLQTAATQHPFIETHISHHNSKHDSNACVDAEHDNSSPAVAVT
jgi:hypothetical protein